jgi:hypothetical protein
VVASGLAEKAAAAAAVIMAGMAQGLSNHTPHATTASGLYTTVSQLGRDGIEWECIMEMLLADAEND